MLDLTERLANHVYAGDFDEAKMRLLIEENRSVGGWLIFYTHDVVETPSAYGCTSEQFEAVVAYAARYAPILPVRDVVAGLGIRAPRPKARSRS